MFIIIRPGVEPILENAEGCLQGHSVFDTMEDAEYALTCLGIANPQFLSIYEIEMPLITKAVKRN